MDPASPVAFIWRGDFTNDELNRLHAEAFGTRSVGALVRWQAAWFTGAPTSASIEIGEGDAANPGLPAAVSAVCGPNHPSTLST